MVILKFVLIILDEVGGTDKKIATAKSKNIHCVSEDFLDEVEKGGAILMITKKSIASWGGDVSSQWEVIILGDGTDLQLRLNVC